MYPNEAQKFESGDYTFLLKSIEQKIRWQATTAIKLSLPDKDIAHIKYQPTNGINAQNIVYVSDNQNIPQIS